MSQMNHYLKPTYFIDFESPIVKEHLRKSTSNANTLIEKVKAIYLYVRDGWRYDPFQICFDKKTFTASHLLKLNYGMCIHKAIIMAALTRALGVPTRFGFADVRNHISTPKMDRLFQTDRYNFHGYVELYINEKWVKATPAFNKSLCDKIGVAPLGFNGEEDSIFQACDLKNGKFMEYLKDYGTFDDIPFDLMVEVLVTSYPHLFKKERGIVLVKSESEIEQMLNRSTNNDGQAT